jgi:hypothetical protein
MLDDVTRGVGLDHVRHYNGSCRNRLEGVEWIYVALDRDKWRAVVNTVMNLHVL